MGVIHFSQCHVFKPWFGPNIVPRASFGMKVVGITDQRKDPVLVHQIISGATPPMPSFQIEPQSMADLIAYLHDLS